MRSRTQPEPQPSWVHPPCECGKVLCVSLADAKKWRRIYAEYNGHHNEVRYYTCRFGRWHWTSQLDWKETA